MVVFCIPTYSSTFQHSALFSRISFKDNFLSGSASHNPNMVSIGFTSLTPKIIENLVSCVENVKWYFTWSLNWQSSWNDSRGKSKKELDTVHLLTLCSKLIRMSSKLFKSSLIFVCIAYKLWLTKAIFWFVSTTLNKVLEQHHKHKDHKDAIWIQSMQHNYLLQNHLWSITKYKSWNLQCFGCFSDTCLGTKNDGKIKNTKNGFFSCVYFTFFRINLVQYGQHSYNHISHFFWWH